MVLDGNINIKNIKFSHKLTYKHKVIIKIPREVFIKLNKVSSTSHGKAMG